MKRVVFAENSLAKVKQTRKALFGEITDEGEEEEENEYERGLNNSLVGADSLGM